jgi:hypothetical protein
MSEIDRVQFNRRIQRQTARDVALRAFLRNETQDAFAERALKKELKRTTNGRKA